MTDNTMEYNNHLLIEKILKARVYDVVKTSPLDLSHALSKRLNNQIFLKREDLQAVFSFKLRGAFNCMYQLTDEQKAKGVIAASAGNHAQGIALAGTQLGIKTKIVMPKTTPEIKIQAVQSFGGKTIIYGGSFDEAYAHALQLQEKEGLTFIHPFDNLDVIAGQGTIAMEILRQHPKPIDAIFIPVGGGGLISGVASYIKYLYPKVKIIGVEHIEAPSMTRSLEAGKIITLEQVGIFADGVAVKRVGHNTFEIARHVIDEMVLVSTDETCAAIKDIFEDTRTLMEPAGALSIAGMKKYIAEKQLKNQYLISICSGANINFDRLRYVAERAELGEHREALIAVTIPEKAGSFKQFCSIIGNRSITEFNYRYADDNNAQVFVGIRTNDGLNEKLAIIDNLKKANYHAFDMSDNELAKVHLRFMVGGHSQGISNEKLLRFRFPEHSGALLHFLNCLGDVWNISLFHYRNHGSDFGRVLVGIQVNPSDDEKFSHFLNDLGYQWWEETNNPAYQCFLK